MEQSLKQLTEKLEKKVKAYVLKVEKLHRKVTKEVFYK